MRALTPRELTVLERLSHGHSIASAAASMGISYSTAKAHLDHARLKLGARNSANAVYLAMRRGLFP